MGEPSLWQWAVALVASSSVLTKIIDNAWNSFREMRAEKKGRETETDRLATQVAELKRIVYVCQQLLLQAGVDKRRIPNVPGERPLEFLEDDDRPDLG